MANHSQTSDWYLSDKRDFRTGFESTGADTDAEYVYLKSVVPRPKNWAFISKTAQPDHYKGKKIKLSALIKTQLPDGASVQLWIRVAGDWKERPEHLDNMFDRRIKGSSEWTKYSVEVDMPPATEYIFYGVLLNGTGIVWLNEVLLESPES